MGGMLSSWTRGVDAVAAADGGDEDEDDEQQQSSVLYKPAPAAAAVITALASDPSNTVQWSVHVHGSTWPLSPRQAHILETFGGHRNALQAGNGTEHRSSYQLRGTFESRNFMALHEDELADQLGIRDIEVVTVISV